ncbi:MAG TPA: hypothetical protein DCW73_02060 [Treponema sp.]|nr:hypothetical protein [Treponema sp.]
MPVSWQRKLNMESNNAFIKLQESANGRVSVKLQKNQFAKDGAESFYGRVERYTYSTQNILDAMADAIPLVDLGTVASVLNAYAGTVLKVLSAGNAVKFGELGIFYIAGKGSVDNENGKPKLTVKFSATQTLKDAVQNVEIAASEYAAPSGLVTSVTDVATGKSDGNLSASSSVLVEGSSLKVGGEDSGIWFAPVAESGIISSDESKWTKIETALIYNLPSKLLFALPQELESGKYKIVVRTRYAGKSGYERKYLVEAISETVTVA